RLAEVDSLARHPVQDGGVDGGIARRAQGVPALVVGEDDDEVGADRGLRGERVGGALFEAGAAQGCREERRGQEEPGGWLHANLLRRLQQERPALYTNDPDGKISSSLRTGRSDALESSPVTADLIVLGVTWFVVFLFSTTLHEAGHAFA